MGSSIIGKKSILAAFALLWTLSIDFTASLDEIRWCVTHQAEVSKIADWDAALKGLGSKIPQIGIRAILAKSPFDCMDKISHSHEADVVTLDGGQIYVAGRDYGMTVLMSETYPTNNKTQGTASYKSVAIIKANDKSINSLNDLRGKKSCHTGVGRTAGWNIPIGILISKGVMKVEDCNNPVTAAAKFFKESCAPLAKEKVHDREGTNPDKMCALCSGRGNLFCSAQDPFVGYNGAFKCLRDGGGEVAFAKGITPLTMTANQTKVGYRDVDFQLLCLDGSRASIYESDKCFWGRAPAHSVLVGKDMTAKDKAQLIQWLETSQMYFGFNSKSFKMFDNPKYGKKNLVFKSNTFLLAPVPGKENYIDYLGPYVNIIRGMSKCSLRDVFMCTTRDKYDECQKLSNAIADRKLIPGLQCYPALDSKSCMSMIDHNQADLALLKEKEIFYATQYYKLKPIFKEVYDKDTYGVAVVKRADRFTNLKNLKGLKACFSGVSDSASYLAPLFSLGIIDSVQTSFKDPLMNTLFKMSQTFGKSCVPGLKEASAPFGREARSETSKMCSLCANPDACSQHNDEYAGMYGVLKCLRNDGADVAFTAMNDALMRSDDLELLCKDGTRAALSQYMRCNLMMVPGKAMVVSSKKSDLEVRDIVNMFRLASKVLDGSLQADGVRLYNMLGSSNTSLFTPGTVKFEPIGPAQQNINYLGTFGENLKKLNTKVKGPNDIRIV